MRQLLRYLLVLGTIAAVTFVDFKLAHVNNATAAFTFLLLILAIATRFGLKESITASLVSVLAYNFFFLPPIGTLTIADPQNWVALFAFLATAMTASQLSSSARREADASRARQQELQRMYDFSRALMLVEDDRTLPQQAIRDISEIFQTDRVSLYDSDADALWHLPVDDASCDRQLREVGRARDEFTLEVDGILILPIGLGGRRWGSLAVRKTSFSTVGLQALGQLLAITMERARARGEASRLSAIRENEKMKSTLLDALAHEFKTPLTSVKAATTTLLGRGAADASSHELLTVIDEETDRMTSLVSDSIELARLGSGPVRLEREVCKAEDLVEDAAQQLRPLLEGRELQIQVTPGLPNVMADKRLTELALRQLIGNAIKYSWEGSPLGVIAEPRDGEVMLCVVNEGPAILKAEQKLLFEKFYRGRDVRGRVAGTGMGLNITREIVTAHGGRIWVESEPDTPTRFCFTLPVTANGNEVAHQE
jgi:two-component system sensor histidine kinase KdpD